MTRDWKDRLYRGLDSPRASRERRLFQELNPGLPSSPILDMPPSEPRPASVLIGIRDTADPSVVFTLRSPTMPSHAGQISLPGGTPKRDDDNLVRTALREAEEEVGLPEAAIEVTGSLGLHYGGLGYVVTPVIGIVDPSAPIRPCPREVSEVFEVPMASLLNPSNHVVQDRLFRDVAYKMFAVPVEDTQGRYRNIWGLTAGILETFSGLFADDDA